jgi:hypothetical protein
MKVDAQLANPALQRSATGQGQPATSFAEVLASGRSAEGIRSERAFGFAETGILGAARFSDATGARTAAPTSGNAPPPLAQQSKASEAMPAPGKQSQISQTITTGRPTSTGRANSFAAASTATFAAMPQGATSGHPQPSFQASLKHPGRQLGKAQFLSPVAAPRPDARRRKLTLQGADDGISINIRLDKDEEAGGDYLLSRFYPICWEFGVTLNAVQLFGWDKESAFSMSGDKQCR